MSIKTSGVSHAHFHQVDQVRATPKKFSLRFSAAMLVTALFESTTRR